MRNLLLLAFVALVPATLQGQDSTARPTVEAIEEFLRVQRAAELHDSLQKFTLDELRKNPLMATFATQMEEVLKEHLSFAKLKADLIGVYQRTFTSSEIRALTEFYSTPMGQSIVLKQFIATREAGLVTSRRMEAVTPEIMRRVQESMRP